MVTCQISTNIAFITQKFIYGILGRKHLRLTYQIALMTIVCTQIANANRLKIVASSKLIKREGPSTSSPSTSSTHAFLRSTGLLARWFVLTELTQSRHLLRQLRFWLRTMFIQLWCQELRISFISSFALQTKHFETINCHNTQLVNEKKRANNVSDAWYTEFLISRLDEHSPESKSELSL